MSPADWIRAGLRALRVRAWGEACPGGRPVPEKDRCAALDCDSVRLSTLAVGESGTVSCLENPGSGPTARLAAMGVLPGVHLVLVQRYPGFVFRIGHSELAVDEELARRIRVRREQGAGTSSGYRD